MNFNVQTAGNFADCASHCMKSTRVIYVPKGRITENVEMKQKLSGVCPIPKLQNVCLKSAKQQNQSCSLVTSPGLK